MKVHPPPDANSESAFSSPSPDAKSVFSLTLTGETMTFTVNDATAITVNSAQESEDGSLSDITVGSIVTVVLIENGTAASVAVGTPRMDAVESAVSLSGVYTVDGCEDFSDQAIIASKTGDENAVLVKNDAVLKLTNATVTKTSESSSTDKSGPTGLNAAIAVISGGNTTISGGSLSSDSGNASTVFASGEGTLVQVENATLSTTGDSSQGLYASSGATITAQDVNIATTGIKSAAITSAGDESTVTANGLALSTTGNESPLLYGVGNITGINLTGTAADGPIAQVEGNHTISLSDSELTGDSGISFDQRASDVEKESPAKLFAGNCKLTTTSSGPFFLVSGTQAEATLSGSTIIFSSGVLAKVSLSSNRDMDGTEDNSFSLHAIGQVLSGDIAVDNHSTFSLTLADGSIYTGAVDSANEGLSVSVSLDAASSWTLTGDAHIDALTNGMQDLSNIQSSGYTLYYDASNEQNAWIGGATVSLDGGGSLTPEPSA